MHKTARTSLLVLCAFGMAAAYAVAQDQQAATEAAATSDANVGMKARSESPLRLSMTLRGVYTDNRDSLPDKHSNFDLYASPSAAIGIETDAGLLDFKYTPSLRYRSNPSDIQHDVTTQHDLTLNGELNVSPEVRLRLREKFDYADDPAIDKQGITIRENESYLLNRIEGGVNWKYTRWSDVDVYVRNMMKRYDASTALFSDEDGNEVGVSLWRQVARTVGVQVLGSINAHSFEEIKGIDRNADFLLGAARIEQKFDRNVRGALAIGVQQTRYKDESLSSRSGMYAAAELHGQILPVLDVTASFTHGMREANVYPFASQDYDQLLARLSYDVSSMVVVGLTGSYLMSQYDGDMAPGAAKPSDFVQGVRSGDETVVSIGADVKVKVSKNSSVTLAQVYEDVSSDVLYSFTKNTTSLSLTATF